MKKTTLLLLAIFAVLPLRASAELPEKANDLLSKLSNWELDRQAELQKEIREKRQEVIVALEAILKETTKTGDLDGALLVKAEIERLQPGTNKAADLETDEPEKPDLSERGLRDTAWQGNGQVFVLRRNGILEVYEETGEKRSEKNWEFNDDGRVYFRWSAQTGVDIEIDKEGETATMVTDGGAKIPMTRTEIPSKANKAE